MRQGLEVRQGHGNHWPGFLSDREVKSLTILFSFIWGGFLALPGVGVSRRFEFTVGEWG